MEKEVTDVNKKLILKLALTTTIGFTYLAAPLTVLAAPGSESEYNQKLEDLSTDQSDAEKELEAVASKIEDRENDMNKLVEEMTATTEALTKLQDEIKVLNEKIEEREARLEEQARAVQVTGDSSSLVEFVMDSDSLGDVIGRLDVVSKLVTANQNLIQEQIDDKELVVEKEKETLAKQEEQTLRAAKLESQKTELEEEQANQERLVASISAQRAKVSEEKDAFLAEQKAAEERMKEIQTARTVAEQTSTISVSDESNGSDKTENNSKTVSTSSSKADVAEKNIPAATNGGSITSVAQSLIGVPYLSAGSTPAGFDCSGFVQYVFRKAGRSITRTAAGQYSATTRITQSQAKPGDLIFFNQSGSIDHVGIYLGGGSFIGSQSSTGVAIASFTSGYWSNHVAGFGRP